MTMDAGSESKCGGCGGPYLFDTSVPSALWNKVVRARGGSEYLCVACVVRRFAEARESFTAELWGSGLDGLTMTVTFKEPE